MKFFTCSWLYALLSLVSMCNMSSLNDLDPSLYDAKSFSSNWLLTPQRPLVSIAFVVPHENLTTPHLRQELANFLSVAGRTNSATFRTRIRKQTNTPNQYKPVIIPRFQVNPVYTYQKSMKEIVDNVFCSSTAKGLNALLIIIDKKTQTKDECRLANFLTTRAHFTGIPSMLWSSDAYEIEDRAASNGEIPNLHVSLLAPTMQKQAKAIIGFLKTHSEQNFCVLIVKATPGADDFLSALLGETDHVEDKAHVRSHVTHVGQLSAVRNSAPVKWRKLIRDELLYIRDHTRSHTVVLWADVEEANDVFSEARILGMLGENYMWIGGKPLMGDNVEYTKNAAPSSRLNTNIAPGTVVANYGTSLSAQAEVIKSATAIWTDAVRCLVASHAVSNGSQVFPTDLCRQNKPPPWKQANVFYKCIQKSKQKSARNDSSSKIGRSIVFSYMDNSYRWRRLGNWSELEGFSADESETQNWETIRSVSYISSKTGIFLKIVTLEELPYIIYSEPNFRTGKCPNNGVRCYLTQERYNELVGPVGFGTMPPLPSSNSTGDVPYACCSGLCIDLLQRLSIDIGFDYQLFEVKDRKWGGRNKHTGEWNGLVRALLDDEADLVLTSLKINQERSEAIEFTLPFLDTGITIMVAVRPGAISPMALLEPFSPGLWLAIIIGCNTAIVLSSFGSEYLAQATEAGFWKKNKPNNNQTCNGKHTFGLLSALWLSLSVLFRAAVRVDLPQSLGAKLVICAWGMFSVIFVSSYMANLAVFMITKDDFYDFTGLEDVRFKNPFSKQPPYKFTTISSGATEAFIKQNYPDLFEYMRQYNETSAATGVQALREGRLDAFIYDATVLEYMSSHDLNCMFNVVGKWYAMTGYGIGFPRGSKWLPIFENFLVEYQYKGFLQKLSKYWLSGACKYRKQAESNKSNRLGISNFASAFVLLLIGLAICFCTMTVEYFVTRYLYRRFISRKVLKRQLSSKVSNLHTVPSDKGILATMFMNALTVRCSNCGGQGHGKVTCSSHPETHLILHNHRLPKQPNAFLSPYMANRRKVFPSNPGNVEFYIGGKQ